MKKHRKALSYALSLLLLASVLTACSQSGTPASSQDAGAPAASSAAASTASEAAPSADGGEFVNTMPITTEDITLTYYTPLNPKVSKTKTNYAEQQYYQELEKITGIKIEFIHPAAGQEQETINLMIASQDFPDFVWQSWAAYVGGFNKAIVDGVAIDLKEPIDKWAPNIKALHEQYPQVRIDSSTDDGKIHHMPVVYVDMIQTSQAGFFIRQDWLDKVGVAMPETIDEWYTAMTAIKNGDVNGDGKPIYPIALVGGSGNLDTQIVKFAGAWGLEAAFVRQGDKAVYSIMDPAYKEFITTMAKWYSEGLIDPEYVSREQADVDDLMGTNQAAVAFERNSKTAALAKIFQTTAPDAVIGGAKYPVTAKGNKPINVNFQLVPVNGNGVTISKNCENVEYAIRWLDYSYSEEGYFLGNWGVEGSPVFEMKDGLPFLTDYAYNNPNGLSMDEAICELGPGGLDSPRRYDPRMYDQRMMTFPFQYDIQTNWEDADHSYRWPMVSMTEEEAAEVSSMQNDINTYRREMMHKLIMGQVPLSEYDTMISTLEGMGVNRLIEIHQAALDRYIART